MPALLGRPGVRAESRRPKTALWRPLASKSHLANSFVLRQNSMERLGHRPKLCSPYEAKRRMGLTNKTDKLDAKGLAILLRNGTLPEVWIPPRELRDQRELLRLRIFLVKLRTRVKNRIHGTLSPHNRRKSNLQQAPRWLPPASISRSPNGEDTSTSNSQRASLSHIASVRLRRTRQARHGSGH